MIHDRMGLDLRPRAAWLSFREVAFEVGACTQRRVNVSSIDT